MSNELEKDRWTMENLFTPSARNVLIIAQEQAKRFKHPAVGTEHLLLALTIETTALPTVC